MINNKSLIICLILISSFQFMQVCLGSTLELILVQDEVKNGAVCLDGTPPGYYFRSSPTNSKNWFLYIQGGAWCNDVSSCYDRSKTNLGSTSSWCKTIETSNVQKVKACWSPDYYFHYGILSDSVQYNPHFYDWNIAFFGYCSGDSFSGNRTDPFIVPNTNISLYIRGRPIMKAILNNLIQTKNLLSASNVIFAGESAGGLATLLAVDWVRSFFSKQTKFQALVDGGWFLSTMKPMIQTDWPIPYFQKGLQLWQSDQNLNQGCLATFAKDQWWKCLFADYSFDYIQTPTFILEPMYDTYQLSYALGDTCVGWGVLVNCSSSQLQYFESFRINMLAAIQKHVIPKSNAGLFLPSCITHVQSWPLIWNTTKIQGHTASQTFVSWYFNNTDGKFQDNCPWHCNLSCTTDP